MSSRAEGLRDAMVDRLLSWGGVTSRAVEQALRTVPRHMFVPDVPLEDAYGPESVITHRDASGVPISSATGPGGIAMMLEQLGLEPGMRVLEVGAGTGYNAACLAELVGPTGHVTTVDIDAEVTREARDHLNTAGYNRIEVVCGDGVAGYAANAPYARIIVTAGAWDIPPAWREQLAGGGRLVVPLRMRGVTRTVAFRADDDGWMSESIAELGFMPIRGNYGVAEQNLNLGPGSGVWLRIDDGQSVDPDSLAEALRQPPEVNWSTTVVPLKPFDHLDLWLAGAPGTSVCRVLVEAKAVTAGLVEPIYPWGSMGVYTSTSFAYLIRRPAEAGEGQEMCEIGVCAYGPDRLWLAERAAAQVQAWGRAQQAGTAVHIEVRPHEAAAFPGALLTADKTRDRVFVIAG
ncbi:methyltransferase, FxLD system [Acrocarpospora sp. B8E8]